MIALRNFHNQIIGRMVLFVVLPILLVLAVIIFLANRSGFQNLRAAAEDRLQLQAELVALQVEDQNADAVLSAQRMAEAQVAGMFGDRVASMEYARKILEGYESITGAYFGYEPNADGKDAESLGQLPAESMDESGRFIPYWFVDSEEGRKIKLEPLVNMEAESGHYYQDPKKIYEETGKAAYVVTQPYVYQGKMITEQVYPIIIDGQFKGVAGVDFALADIATKLRKIGQVQGVDLFLISSQNKFIAATTDPESDTEAGTQTLLTAQAIAETKYRQLFADLLGEDRKYVPTSAVDPVDGERHYFAVADVHTGGWTVVARQSESEILAPIWQQTITRLTLALIGVAITMGLLLTMTFRLGGRINRAAVAAERIAEGNLAIDIPEDKGKDETGVLLRAIKKMTENLNGLVGNVKQASIGMNSTATELAATSRQQESTVSSFGASTNEIAAGVKQISATSCELVSTMSEVNEVAVGTADLATRGRASLQEMEENTRDLEKATASIGQKLAAINERATNITGVVTTITKVADQTNLLSVNAAIEAEKAGEYGVGFLVVAREIRRLADQTAAATLDIDQMVGQMQSAVSTGVMEMDRFTDQVRRNVQDVAQISHQMAEIIERVNANTEKFELVNESMQSQSQGAEQISQAMEHLTSNAAQTTQAIGEYARAADDLQTAIGSLKSSISSFQLKAD